MFAFVLPLFALPVAAAFSPQQCTEGPAPVVDLKAAYTRGEPLSLAVDATNRLAFLAEGAEIAILGINPIPTATEFAPVGARIAVDCSPIAMTLNGEDQLLIAGGSQGLWAIDLCTGLWGTTPSACSSYTPFLVDSATPTALSRKVCYDVVTLAGEDCDIAVALFSAVDANELRCYTLPLGSSQTPFKTVPLTTPSNAKSIGYALARDRSLDGSVFVAVGTGGLIRVTGLCDGETAQETRVDFQPDPQSGLPSTGAYPFATGTLGKERVVDVETIVSAEGVGRAYALLDYGRIVGFDVSGGTWNTTQLWQVHLAADELVFARHLQAIVLHPPTSEPTHRRVLLTVGAHKSSVLGTDHGAPYFVTGRWSAGFGVGIADPNLKVPSPTDPPPAIHDEPSVHAYTEDLLSTGAPSVVTGFPLDIDDPWRAMVLRPVSTSGAIICRNYECVTGGLDVRRIANPTNVGSTASNSLVWQGTGRVIAPISVMVPRFNPDFPMFSIDNVGPSLPADKRRLSVSGSTTTFMDASGTSFGCFSSTSLTLPDTFPTNCPGDSLADINPWSGPPISGTSWRKDEGKTSTEFVVVGSPSIYRQILGCPSSGSPTNLAPHDPDHCPPNTQWYSYADATEGFGGWRVVRLPIGFTGTTSPAEWQQVPSTSAGGINNCVYMGSFGDYRDVTGVPAYQGPKNIFLTRSSAEYGVVAVDGQSFATLVDTSTSDKNGGIVDLTLSSDQSVEVVTHHELAYTITGMDRHRRNREAVVTGSQSFGFNLGSGVVPFVAVACGSIIAERDNDITAHTSDPFEGFELQSRAVIYHVQDYVPATSSTSATPLALEARVMLLRTKYFNPNPLTEDERSTAMSIRVKRLCDPLDEGRFSTFAFVADFNGRLFVYKLDSAILGTDANGFPSGVPDPYSALEPIYTLDLGVNVFDGMRHNITAMELVGNHAYLACVRLGVVVVDLSSPTVPTVLSMTGWPSNYPQGVLETPGLVTGLAVRTISNIPTLVVADTRGGYRLYGRP